MAVVYALILAAVGALFVYLALQVEGGFSLTSLNLAAYYVTVAFIAFVNMILFASAVFAIKPLVSIHGSKPRVWKRDSIVGWRAATTLGRAQSWSPKT
jgi:ABC-type Fe3+-siderophore transport system permease subunit